MPKGLYPRPTLQERVVKFIIPEPMSGCWLWIGETNKTGYAKIKTPINGIVKNLRVTKIMYEQYIGPVPDGLFLLHKCDTPSCVNPYHMFTGKHKENNHDCIKKKRNNIGQKNGQAKLTNEQIINIRKDVRPQRIIAKDYGVSHQNISRIKGFKQWKHIP
jgi:hypothetical protein